MLAVSGQPQLTASHPGLAMPSCCWLKLSPLAFFNDGKDKGKARANDVECSSKGHKKNNNKKKKARQGKWETVDDDLIAAVERKKPRGLPEGAIFHKMLKEPYPTREGPTTSLRIAAW